MAEKELKMKQEELWQKVTELPPEAQREVFDFIAFLQKRYSNLRRHRKSTMAKLVEESFIGIWRGRDDMNDSSAWVRGIREGEWGQTK